MGSTWNEHISIHKNFEVGFFFPQKEKVQEDIYWLASEMDGRWVLEPTIRLDHENQIMP